MPSSRELSIPATDGFPLAATLHEADRPEALVLLNAATAVPRRFYARFADHLASRGLSALAYDYRGVGGSRPATLRGFDARMSDWGEKDLAGVLAWSGKELPDLPVVAVGHSAGGQILGLAEGRGRIRALLGVAAQSGHWRHWRGLGRMRRALDWHVLVPGVSTAFGRLPKWALGTEVPKGVALEWARWCRHPEYVVRGDPSRRASFASWTGRIRALSFADDPWAPAESVEALLALYPGARREHVHVSRAMAGAPVGHFGFFKPVFRDTLWKDAAGWLRAQATASH